MRPEGQGRFVACPGFYSEAGKFEELDAACQAARLPRVEIRHQSGATKLHWSWGEAITICPLTAGPTMQSVFQLKTPGKAQSMAQAGLGARWTTDWNGRPKSQVAVRCLVPALQDVGWNGVVQLVAASTMSDYLLRALQEHLSVGHAAVKALGKEVVLAELELPLGPGADVTVGKDQQMTLTPLVAQHPKALTPDYLAAIYRPRNRALVEQLWPSVVAWAEEYAASGHSEEEQAASQRASQPSDLYLPQPGEMELAISQARTQDVLEAYRSYILDLRERGEIPMQEQVRLSGLIEDRLDALVGAI
jgi:hypothetical protein